MNICKTCAAEFEASNPLIKNCPACKRKHAAEYAKKWRKSKGTIPVGDPTDCSDCGIEFPRTPGPNTRCPACVKKNRDATNTRWLKSHKDMVRVSAKRARDNYRFDGMRYRALKRDKFTCQHCGTCEDLHVHHLDETGHTKQSGTPEKPNNRLDNLITLCRGCHRKEHARLAKL